MTGTGVAAVTHGLELVHTQETGQVASTRSLSTRDVNAAQVPTQTGVTDTPNPAQLEAAWTVEVGDQHEIGIGTETVTEIEIARKETRKGIEIENEIMKERKKMKETLRFCLQYLRKFLF